MNLYVSHSLIIVSYTRPFLMLNDKKENVDDKLGSFTFSALDNQNFHYAVLHNVTVMLRYVLLVLPVP